MKSHSKWEKHSKAGAKEGRARELSYFPIVLWNQIWALLIQSSALSFELIACGPKSWGFLALHGIKKKNSIELKHIEKCTLVLIINVPLDFLHMSTPT